MRTIFPAILIIISLATFFFFINPRYQDVHAYKSQIAEYDEALNNEIKLEQDRDALSTKYHSFPIQAQERLVKMLPDNADNIRLVIDIQKIAASQGVTVMSINFDSNQAKDSGADSRTAQKDYGVFDLEFSVSGTYKNFLQFLKVMESSLRITDLQEVTFSAGGDKDVYNYDIKTKTYWLRAK